MVSKILRGSLALTKDRLVRLEIERQAVQQRIEADLSQLLAQKSQIDAVDKSLTNLHSRCSTLRSSVAQLLSRLTL